MLGPPLYQVGGLNMQKEKKHELLWPMTEPVPTEKNINEKVKLCFQASKSKSVTEAGNVYSYFSIMKEKRWTELIEQYSYTGEHKDSV